MDQRTQEEFNKYVDNNGKIISYPSKKHRFIRPYLYEYLITKFNKDSDYSEKEINSIINEWILFEDYCLVRREMVEQGLLIRNRDCSKYSVSK